MSDERKAEAGFAGAHGWAAMCDAPKDGTEILVWTHRKQHELARWDASAEELGLAVPQSVRDAVAAARYDLERIERAELERQRHE